MRHAGTGAEDNGGGGWRRQQVDVGALVLTLGRRQHWGPAAPLAEGYFRWRPAHEKLPLGSSPCWEGLSRLTVLPA
ncbi:hypothetical protein BaRGS_00009919 [Batillaria attramentaria]|uniref:Uncharacterized protein n=1 Tax=Batillaria attramentaria TaxID=370345 RepID=A0ABD0LH13_9CAEN